MRSTVFLLVGLIAGFVASNFLSTSKVNIPKKSADANEHVTAAIVSESGSPFSIIEPLTDSDSVSDSDTDTISDTGAEAGSVKKKLSSTGPQSGFTEAIDTELALSEITHYRELANVLSYIDKANSDKLLTLVQQLSSGNIGRMDYYTSAISAAIYQRWAIVDIDAALDHIVKMVDSPADSTHLELDGISILASMQPDYLQRWLGELKHTDRSMIEHQVVAGITSQDPEAFVRKISQQGIGDIRDNGMLYGAVMQWAEKDPEAAWDFLETEGDPETSDALRSPILYSWLDRDPQGALSELEVLIESVDKTNPERMMLQDMYGSALAQTDPTAALQWAASLIGSNLEAVGGQELQHGVLPNVLYQVAETDPMAIEQWVDQLPAAKKEVLLPIALPVLAQSLAERDPLQALAFLEKYPVESDFDNRQMVVQSWMYIDREAATDWLTTLPSGVANDQLTVDTALSMIHEDTGLAMSLLNGMQGAVSADIAISVAANLANVDPNSAAEWLSKQSDPKVLEAGSLYIDINQNSASTAELLARIERLSSSDNKMMLVLKVMDNANAEDCETISHWVSNTNAITAVERKQLEVMSNLPVHMQPPGGFYTRHQNCK